jgi:hypothetical protein
MRLCLWIILAGVAAAQSHSTWKDYAGAADGARYSTLTQIDKTDRLGLTAIEGSNQQQVSPEIRKKLAPGLSAEEVAAVQAGWVGSRRTGPSSSSRRRWGRGG